MLLSATRLYSSQHILLVIYHISGSCDCSYALVIGAHTGIGRKHRHRNRNAFASRFQLQPLGEFILGGVQSKQSCRAEAERQHVSYLDMCTVYTLPTE